MNTLTAWRMAICYSPSSEPQKETFLKSQGTNHHWLTLTVQDTRQLEVGWGKWLNEWTGKGRAVLQAAGAACKAIVRHSQRGPFDSSRGVSTMGPCFCSRTTPPRGWLRDRGGLTIPMSVYAWGGGGDTGHFCTYRRTAPDKTPLYHIHYPVFKSNQQATAPPPPPPPPPLFLNSRFS